MAARVPAQSSHSEAARQAALDAYAIVDSGAEQAFDDIVRLAVTLCGVSAASISLIDHDRVWFKAQIGVDQSQVARELSLCNHAIDQPGRTLVIDDLDIDPESLDWWSLTPAQRFVESQKLWATFIALGGSLDPEPDSQSPFFDPEAARAGAAHGRTGVHSLRRGGVQPRRRSGGARRRKKP